MTIEFGAVSLVAALCSALAAGALMKFAIPPPKRLRVRVNPYLTPSALTNPASQHQGPLSSIFGPMVHDLADRMGRILEKAGADVTLIKLRQAGWFGGLREQEMTSAYRVMQLKTLVVSLLLAAALGQLMGASLVVRVVFIGLAVVLGVSRTRGRLDRAIEDRRDRMKIEVYTINQLLAMRVRAGGGVMQAVGATVKRGSGEVVSELEEVLRLHRSGWSGPDAFRRVAELTPEPFCSRTYRLLASAEERGADLAGALLSLSEDVRETRRESIKRTATKRRAAMLVPTIAILAPVLILFVAAPLPYLITAWQ